MTDRAAAMAVQSVARTPNEEAIRLLRANRKTAVQFKSDHEAALKRAEAACSECGREVKRMVARIEAIDRAIVTLGGKLEAKSEG